MRTLETTKPIVVLVDEDERRMLDRKIAGRGGFQSLLREIKRNLSGQLLTMTPALAQRIARYGTRYGSGGFQQRLARLVAAISRVDNDR